ncbi:MAG: type IV-A pilus assembly ATPase PilB [Elusimicrobiota bacterium]
MAGIKSSGIKKKLGAILIEVGLITPQQLDQALAAQKKQGGKLGQVLIQMGFIAEEVLLGFLGRQCGVNFVKLSDYGEITRDAVKLVPENIARHQLIIPIACEGNLLTVAMANPLNVFVIDDLRLMTGKEMQVVLASEQEIKNAIDKIYSKKSLDPDGDNSEKDSGGSNNDFMNLVKEMEGRSLDNLEVVKEDAGRADSISLDAAGEAPIIKMVNLILALAIKSGASDIHIEPYEKSMRIRYRIDGVLYEQSTIPKRFQNAVISRTKIMSSLDIAERRLPQDGRIKIKVGKKEVDLRVSVCPTAFGEKVVMRILDSSSLCLDLTKLGFDQETMERYKKNIEVPYGIILVTGPTGSGKSTTLYSTLSTLNFPDRNIITVEDPVEYVLEGINQVQARPEIGLTFAAGLRSFLRQDPDIIMVGEIRDTETAEIAINAALTGHLVFSTLHTNDAPGAITRLNNMGIEPFLTTSTVIMVVAQRLVRVICKNCKEPYQVPADYVKEFGVGLPEDVQEVTLYRGRGCEVCSNTGYKGRLACYEIMEVNDRIRDLVLERASAHLIKQAARENGMVTLREGALRKVFDGVTTVEEMLRVTYADA